MMKNGLLSRTRKAAHAGAAMLRQGGPDAAEATAGASPGGGALVWVYAVTTDLDPGRLDGLTGVGVLVRRPARHLGVRARLLAADQPPAQLKPATSPA